MTDSPALNMVQGQIAPNGVTNDAVLGAFLTVDRAAYLTPALAAFAYCEDNIVENGHVVMLRPLTLAIIAQYLAHFHARGAVAIIGDATSYTADIVQAVGFTATSVIDEEELNKGAPWQAIILNGAVPHIPSFFYNYLAPHGQVLCVVQKEGEVMGEIVASDAPDHYHVLGQAGAPLLREFISKPEFIL